MYCPRLQALLDSGHIIEEEEYFIGVTDTGEVCLGATIDPDSVEAYLASHPTPSSW